MQTCAYLCITLRVTTNSFVNWITHRVNNCLTVPPNTSKFVLGSTTKSETKITPKPAREKGLDRFSKGWQDKTNSNGHKGQRQKEKHHGKHQDRHRVRRP